VPSELLLAVIGILGALVVGIVSPGPSFVLVARTAVAMSRQDGIAASVGMGLGGVFFASLALVGLQAVLAQVAWLYLGLKLLGGLYLIYLAVGLWRGAAEPIALEDAAERGRGEWRKSFWLGLATQLSNPKTAVVYGSVFAALLPPDPPSTIYAVLLPPIFVLETGWYTAVAMVFSAGRPRAVYLAAKLWIDRVAGSVMAALGLRLIVETARSG
jgi:threonine/homoserine/homoserine lactone efflux protein